LDPTTEFKLVPYVGASPIRFGMSPKEIESLLGPPRAVSSDHNKERVEFRSLMNVSYSSGDERADHIGFGRRMVGVRYRDLAIFSDPAALVLQNLVAEDGSPNIMLEASCCLSSVWP
jgi:hypothetical protein